MYRDYQQLTKKEIAERIKVSLNSNGLSPLATPKEVDLHNQILDRIRKRLYQAFHLAEP